jgi:hypothetical protein
MQSPPPIRKARPSHRAATDSQKALTAHPQQADSATEDRDGRAQCQAPHADPPAASLTRIRRRQRRSRQRWATAAPTPRRGAHLHAGLGGNALLFSSMNFANFSASWLAQCSSQPRSGGALPVRRERLVHRGSRDRRAAQGHRDLVEAFAHIARCVEARHAGRVVRVGLDIADRVEHGA